MTLLALPFVSGELRTSGTGARLVLGLLIGLVYYVVAQTFESSGEVFDIDPIVVAWLPSSILFGITAVALLRIR